MKHKRAELINFCRNNYDICDDRLEDQVENCVNDIFGESND